MVRYIGLARETDFGEAVTTPDIYIDVVSESITPEHTTIYPELAGYRWAREGIEGGKIETGSFDMIVRSENICELLKSLFGEVETTKDNEVTPLAYKHEFLPQTSLPSLTLHIGPEVGGQQRQVPGTAIPSIEFEAVARELLTATVNVLGCVETKTAEKTGFDFTTVAPFVFTQGTITIDTPVANVESFRVTPENDIPDDAFVIGNETLPRVHLQGFKVTGSMDLSFIDWTQYDAFLAHAPVALTLDFQGAATPSSESGFEYHRIKFEMPVVYLDTSEANFDRRDRIIQGIDFTAVEGTIGTDKVPLKVTVVNTQSAVE